MIFSIIFVYNESGDNMSFLAISNGNSSTDLIKIKEGEVWQIDKYTMTFQNSDEIRTKNAAAYRLFLERYPSGRRGAIRLFKPSSHHIGEYHEWTVLYKKHYVAFAKIIQDVSFMRMLVRRSNSFFSRYDYHEITYHPERLKVHMNRYCQNLKKKDQEETNEKGGGKNFYTFMREVLYQYTEYQKQYPGCPSIDTIYQQVMEEKAKSKKKEVVSPNVEKLPDIPLSSPVGEKDPDIVLFDQMDVPIEGKEDPLRDFLYGGDHAHRWTSMFEQEYLFLFRIHH